jgi:ankyrin repeat protein
MCILTELGSLYFTPLHIAIRNRDPESVQMLLNAGANPSAQCRYNGRFYDAVGYVIQLTLQNGDHDGKLKTILDLLSPRDQWLTYGQYIGA